MRIGYVYVLLAALLWGSSAAVAKLLLVDLDTLQILPFTTLFAALGLLAMLLLQRKGGIIRRYKKEDYFVFAKMGFLGIFLYYLFFYIGLQLLPAQEAFIINYLWPIAVVFFATVILKETVTLIKMLGIICSFIGVGLTVSEGNLTSLHVGNGAGIILVITAALAYGLFSVLGKKLHYEQFTSMMFYYFFAFVYAVIPALLFSDIPRISLLQLLGLLWLGVFANGFGYIAWFLALKHGDTAKMSNIIFLTPLISLVFIHFLVGEQILVSSIIGLVVIMIGILIQSLAGRKHPAETTPSDRRQHSDRVETKWT